MLKASLMSRLSLPIEPLEGVLALFAGEGLLPFQVAREAQSQGFSVIVYCLTLANRLRFEQQGFMTRTLKPTLARQTREQLARDGVRYFTMAGKFNKWLLFTNWQVDGEALAFLSGVRQKNDDGLVLAIINQFEQRCGLTVLPQTRFMTGLIAQEAGCLTLKPLEQARWFDVAYGYALAKASAGLDIGQTVVVHDTMAIAIEAIEGTDRCLKRAGALTRGKGGTVVKVAKPQQDDRFDVPTVGLRTLKTMQKVGLTTLATEAGATIYLEQDAMIGYANQHNMAMVSLTKAMLEPYLAQLHIGNNNPLVSP
jgi:UDP-2,3-diacylglucosamine hydrolase